MLLSICYQLWQEVHGHEKEAKHCYHSSQYIIHSYIVVGVGDIVKEKIGVVLCVLTNFRFFLL